MAGRFYWRGFNLSQVAGSLPNVVFFIVDEEGHAQRRADPSIVSKLARWMDDDLRKLARWGVYDTARCEQCGKHWVVGRFAVGQLPPLADSAFCPKCRPTSRRQRRKRKPRNLTN